MATSVSRRSFARLFALGGSAALFSDPAWARQAPAAPALAPGGAAGGEAFWKSVRNQFVMPADLAVMNAANLCPASRPALESLARETHSVDRDPSPNNRARLYPEKEHTRKALAEFLRVTADEIIITRNTSESNNLVSSGLDLKPGDEVIVHSDNHPSNLAAWREGQALRILGRDRRPEESASGTGVLRRGVHARDHTAEQGAVLYASLEHGRRPDAGEGVVPARARAWRPDARRRGAELRPARRQPRRDPAGLLLGQRPQVAVRRPRMRRALRQQGRTGEALAQHL